jgi:isocitrate dehydrogenase
MSNTPTPITVAYGDGIGPEIMEAVLAILRYAKAPITVEVVEVGKRMFEKGYLSGIGPDMWDSMKQTRLLLKGPITTPQGGGYKSLNVTMRKALGLYANVRPVVAYHPYVHTNHPQMNLVVVRENEEDLYTGIEYRQTHNTYESLKLISETGSERIIRYAFEYAIKNNRKKVTCLSKDNIMKMTDGTFHRIFNEVAKEYPSLTSEHYIIDIGAARLATRPEHFDVAVTSNLYGDIISDIVAEISGSVGLAGSANIGQEYAMFEAVHGSAPDIAGKNMANPSGLLHAAIMMLVHIGATDVAASIHNAWYVALEEGLHTPDIYKEGHSKEKLGTKEFGEAVIARLGKVPASMPKVVYNAADATHKTTAALTIKQKETKKLVGVDVYIDWIPTAENSIATLAETILSACDGDLQLQAIAILGLAVWPKALGVVPQGDHWCLRFVPKNTDKITQYEEILHLLTRLRDRSILAIKTENLYVFGDTLGFAAIQGE